MSVQSTVQHAASSLGAIMSAHVLQELPDHSLVGMQTIGAAAIVLALFLPVLLRRIEKDITRRDAELGPPYVEQKLS
jgi:hypothetical protein